MIIRQSTAITIGIGPFVDSIDGNTVEDALSITQPDIRLSKNGAAFAQKSAAQTLTHMENGYYSLSLSATDTDTVGRLRVHCHKAGALPTWEIFQIVEEAVYDANYADSATGLLPTNVTQIAGAAVSTTTAQLGVNVVNAAGTAWASGAITAASIAASAITDTKIATGAFTAAKFAAGAFDAVWTVTARLLTAGTNIALAKGTGVTGFNDITAADVWAAVTRTLSAGTNIVLAKGTGVTGFNDLSAAQVNTEADTAIADAALATASSITALNNISTAQVNAEILDVLTVDTFAQPGQEAPAATTTLHSMIRYLYKFARNKLDNTGTLTRVYSDDGTTIDHKATVGEASGTVTRDKFGTGP